MEEIVKKAEIETVDMERDLRRIISESTDITEAMNTLSKSYEVINFQLWEMQGQPTYKENKSKENGTRLYLLPYLSESKQLVRVGYKRNLCGNEELRPPEELTKGIMIHIAVEDSQRPEHMKELTETSNKPRCPLQDPIFQLENEVWQRFGLTMAYYRNEDCFRELVKFPIREKRFKEVLDQYKSAVNRAVAWLRRDYN